MTTEIPTGLVGLRPRQPIGCHINVAVKGKNGAPAYKGRFWIMSQLTHSQEFVTGGGKSYRQLARDLHPSFGAWNEAALALGSDISRKGPGRLGVLRGNIVHARVQDAALWNRSAPKLPEGHPNPPSRRPACEGNGVWALRYSRVEDGREVFDRIACPNRECVFAIQGLCKATAHLIFRLRWSESDPWEAQFPALLAEWTTRSPESTENMLGLFEHVLGTEALLTEEQRKLTTDAERAKWRSGLAQEMGIAEPSLVGLPFILSVGDKTKTAEAGSSTGKRFPIVKFSTDGDLVEWLLMQARRRRELVTVPEPLTLPPASVRDADFLEVTRHESRVEIDPTQIEISPPSGTIEPQGVPGDASANPPDGGEVVIESTSAKPAPSDEAAGEIPQTPPGAGSSVPMDGGGHKPAGSADGLSGAQVAELKKLAWQAGKSWDEDVIPHFGPPEAMIGNPFDLYAKVVALIKAKPPGRKR